MSILYSGPSRPTVAARTTKSVTVTQLGNSYSTTSGYRTAGTVFNNVSVGAERSTANQPARCRQASCFRVEQWSTGKVRLPTVDSSMICGTTRRLKPLVDTAERSARVD